MSSLDAMLPPLRNKHTDITTEISKTVLRALRLVFRTAGNVSGSVSLDVGVVSEETGVSTRNVYTIWSYFQNTDQFHTGLRQASSETKNSTAADDEARNHLRRHEWSTRPRMH